MVYSSNLNPFDVDTWKGDLSAFQAHGGKLLHYHGTQDTYISSFNSERYYNYVSRTMNLSSGDLDSFYRYFRIGGMGHCLGGPGAWELGQGNGALATNNTPQQNILLRLVDWVENGQAPETVTGTKFVNDTETLGVQFTRNHCKYPTRNMFVGRGSSTDPDNWACV
jgi:feruloyl esterase